MLNIFITFIYIFLSSCSSIQNSYREYSSIKNSSQCNLKTLTDRLNTQENDYLYDCKKHLYSPKFAKLNIFSEQKILNTIKSLDTHSQLEEKLYFLGVAFYHHTVKNYTIENYSNLSRLALEKEKSLQILDLFSNVDQNKSLFQSWIKFIDGFKKPSSHAFLNLEKVLLYYKKSSPLSKEDKTLLFSTIVLSQRLFSNKDNIEFVSRNFLEIINHYSYYQSNIQEQYIINNAIWAMRNYYSFSTGSNFSSLNPYVEQLLKSRLQSSKKDSETYLWTLKSLLLRKECFSLNNQNNSKICKKDIDQKIYTKILKNNYKYQNENIEVITSLSKSTINSLIEELKKVKENFHLLTGVMTPLPSDINEKLKMVIFNSPEDYKKYQPFLHDLPTSNGGIYIEKGATFYTYQRLPHQSRYTLEELTKHEYVHYLTGRYINHGYWGQTDFYRKSQMPWFEEGIAEVLTGSHLDGLRFRKKLSHLIARDNKKMSLSEIIKSEYSSGFRFYRYSSALITFLNQEYLDSEKTYLQQILSYFIENDFSKYQELLAFIKNDNELNLKFQDFITSITTKKEYYIFNKRKDGYIGKRPIVKNSSSLFKSSFVELYTINFKDPENNFILDCEIVETSGVKIRNDGKCIRSGTHWKVDIAVNGNVPEEEIFFKLRLKDIDGWSNISTHKFIRSNAKDNSGNLIQLSLAPKIIDIKKKTKNIHVEHFYIEDLVENNAPIRTCKVIQNKGLKVRQGGKCLRASNGKWFIDIELRHELTTDNKFFIYEVTNKHGSSRAKVQYTLLED